MPSSNPEDLVQEVLFHLEKQMGQCIKCKCEGVVLRIVADIFVPGKNEFGQSGCFKYVWFADYCPFCVASAMEVKKEEVPGYG